MRVKPYPRSIANRLRILSPLWTVDGKRIIWTSTRGGGNPNLFWQPFDGTGAPERLAIFQSAQFPTTITPDGSAVIAFATSGKFANLFRVALSGTQTKPELLMSLEANQYGAEISPNGRWLAYHSNESGSTGLRPAI